MKTNNFENKILCNILFYFDAINIRPRQQLNTLRVTYEVRTLCLACQFDFRHIASVQLPTYTFIPWGVSGDTSNRPWILTQLYTNSYCQTYCDITLRGSYHHSSYRKLLAHSTTPCLFPDGLLEWYRRWCQHSPACTAASVPMIDSVCRTRRSELGAST